MTELRHERSTLWVLWVKQILPPKVKLGAVVMVYGKLMTFGNGRSFQLVDSVLCKGKPQATGAALSKLLQPFIVDPSTYLPADLIHGDDFEGLVLPQPAMRGPIP